MHVIATAGHVDHGKSTLVRALTGMDPDRLEEEKKRGLTIDLGFAWTTLSSGQELAFVDVPGHVRFIKNMLAGVGAVDACLFVVAATEGWKPQSEEHLRILELMGTQQGVIALTKVAGLDDQWLELAHLEVEEKTAGTFLEDAPVVKVDAPEGIGMIDLAERLELLVSSSPAAADRDRPRLWVDRSFSAKGSGTVVTGTLTGGRLAVDDEMLVVGPGPPAAQAPKVRIRALQSHKQQHRLLGPGRRVAVNLSGVAASRVTRGDALVKPGQWALTRMVDCSLQILESLDHPVSRRGAYRAYIGSGEHPARIRLLSSSSLRPGENGFVRLHLPVSVPLVPGDRYVLRESGRSETVGGGEILDVDPVLPASKAAPTRSIARIVAERQWTEADVMEQLTGERVPANVGGRWVVDKDALEHARAKLRATLREAGGLGVEMAALGERTRAVAAGMDDVILEAGRARFSGSSTARELLQNHPAVQGLKQPPFSPPQPQQVEPSQLRQLVREGLVVEKDGLYFSPDAVDRAAQIMARLLKEAPEGVTVATIRDALGTTRKFLLPLLSHLDSTGVTRRRGDLRIAGPRLPGLTGRDDSSGSALYS